MANIYPVPANTPNKSYPLRGDMTGCAIGFTPSSAFKLGFFTEDSKQYTITALNQFKINGAISTNKSFTFGGQPGLFVSFIFQPEDGLWECDKNNLVAGTSSSSGSGGTTLTGGTATSLAYGANPTVAIRTVGSVSYLDLGIPAGKDGTSGTGSTGGTSLPVPPAIGYVLTAIGTTAGQYAWAPAPSGTGSGSGTGTGTSAEITVTPDSNNQITLNAALGNCFRIVIDGPIKMMNPVGYSAGNKLTIHFVRGATSTDMPTWDINWGFVDRQPPTLATTPGAINRLDCALTTTLDTKPTWTVMASPDSTHVLGYSPAAFIARNVQRQTQYYVLRSPTVPASGCGLTDLKPGETLKIIRNGLGIEAFGAIDGNNGSGSFLITGALDNGNRAELRTGPGVRTAYDKGVIAIGANTVTVQDLILSGAREQSGASHIAQGISISGNCNVTVKNVRLYDNENGLLSANDWTGSLDLYDCDFDGNGVGLDYGYVHNIYMGHHLTPWTATRCTFQNAVGGHNIKSRAGITTLNQVRCYNSLASRELDIPNGGKVYATDCIFDHPDVGVQHDIVRIGDEGMDLSRLREYIFRNCHFRSGTGASAGGSYIWNQDPDVPVYLIDCTFDGAKGPGTANPGGGSTDTSGIWPGTDVNGNIGNVIVQFTGGVKGPRVSVGYQPLAVTPVAG